MSATPDGCYLFFVSDRAGGNHLFRMNQDSSGLKQLCDRRLGLANSLVRPSPMQVINPEHSGHKKIRGSRSEQVLDIELYSCARVWPKV